MGYDPQVCHVGKLGRAEEYAYDVDKDYLAYPGVFRENIFIPATSFGIVHVGTPSMTKAQFIPNIGGGLPIYGLRCARTVGGAESHAHFSFQLPHKYAPGTYLRFFGKVSRLDPDPGAGVIKFTMNYVCADSTGVIPSGVFGAASASIFLQELSGNVSHRENAQIGMTDVSIPALDESSIFQCSLYRDTTDTFASDDVFLLGIDVMYILEKPGTQNEFSPYHSYAD